MLMMLGYDILFYTSSLEITNYDANKLPFKIHYYPNQPCGCGTDWYMWIDGYKKIQKQNKIYDWIMLINDSTLLGIHGIDNMKKSINEMRDKNSYNFLLCVDGSELGDIVLSNTLNLRKKNDFLSKLYWKIKEIG
jgi:hypothetical protein